MTNKRKAWAVMGVVFLASVAIAANRFKVPPVLPTLMAELGVDMVTGGWLVSISSIAGVALSIPAAVLLNRIGLKLTGIVALGCAVVGPIIGALAPSTEFLLLGGVAEGIGATLISVVAPAAISRWFKLEDRGLPMGIWAGWVPVGNVIMFNLAHPLAGALGWRAVWWFGALFSFLALILFILVVTTPPEKKTRAPVEPPPAQAFRRGLLNPTAWLLGLGFGTFGFCLLGYNSWAPTFLTETLRIDPAAASSYASLMFLAAIPANIVAGWMINRLRNRQYVLPVTFLVMGVLLFWSFRLSSSVVVMPYMIALGFISNFIPATSFTLAPETAPDAASANMALAIMNVGSNAGALAGPPAIGAIVSGGNWSAGSTGLVIVAIAGTMLSWIIARKLEENDGSH